jgi:hypothetical protein
MGKGVLSFWEEGLKKAEDLKKDKRGKVQFKAATNNGTDG